jgi:hypothetical protein
MLLLNKPSMQYVKLIFILEHLQNKQFIKQSVRFKTIFFVRGFLASNPPPNLKKSDSLFSQKLRQTVIKFLIQQSHVEICI